MQFWIAIALLGILCGVVLALPFLKRRNDSMQSVDYDLRVYRDQLNEVDRDLARGVILPEEAARVQTEVSRRILQADSRHRARHEFGNPTRAAGILTALLVFAALTAGSFLLYIRIGAPGIADMPIEKRIELSDIARSQRLSQSAAEARAPATPPTEASGEFLDLMEKLRAKVAENPDDPRGLEFLVRNESALGNFTAAHKAQARLISAKKEFATAEDHAHLSDLMITAAAGYISADAEAALREALKINPSEPLALYYLGLYFIQVDRPDKAFRLWDGLLRSSPPDAPWTPVIHNRISDLAWLAGDFNYEAPGTSTVRGPSREDIETAAEMTPEERQNMILSMVSGLADRLANEGGPAEDWARLIVALGKIGDSQKAREIHDEALEIFAASPQALRTIGNAASEIGISN
ncbi:MAG: c-type cytochrome biogenesis protein CcmI [Roseovarius sp.]|nr:c-type cytochrome biogenesis protein CcmI [Roseovarius sp.]